jgi:hypothetical protein
MANAPHLFKDLQLTDYAGEVKGIGDGLAIEGKGMFKFSLKDDQGKIHNIKNPKQSLLTWFEAVPPITTTLGAGGRRRANMDRKLRKRVCAALARGRQENSLL